MNDFQNNPLFRNVDGKVQKGAYVHQPLTFEHYGTHVKIQENGRVRITSEPVRGADGELEYDEVEIPASLVFKLATMLKTTRTIQFKDVEEPQPVAVKG